MSQVKELMETNLAIIEADATLKEAAQKMRDMQCGFLPVAHDDSPQGIITDRDIVVRAIAEGKDPEVELVQNYMSKDAFFCSEDSTLEEASRVMNENGVGRLIVKDNEGKICGILTFGRIIRSNENKQETSDVVDHAVANKAA